MSTKLKLHKELKPITIARKVMNIENTYHRKNQHTCQQKQKALQK